MTQPYSPDPRGHTRSTPGRLKVYLGSAPGVGKTYRMLDEGRRRLDRGTDVVVGYVESHNRRRTEERLAGLEVLPRLHREYRGAQFTEMDVDAVLARRPEVALVDELAHTNIPGGKHAKRWQDVRDLLDAGIDVLTTVNIQHLESLNDVVQKITGVPQRETVPDEVVRRADQIELVDMPPEGLRRRMVHGNVYGPEKVDAALSNYFRVGNLIALRELALLWLAGRVDEGLQRYRAEHGIGGVWETRERVVVALTGGPEGETLVRRAARIADRASGGDLLAVHVARSDGLADASPAALSAQRQLAESLGGSYHSVVGDNIPTALLDFARAENATQLVLGTSRRSALLRAVTGRGIGETTVELSGDIDVHMVTHEQSGRGRRLPMPGGPHPTMQRVAGATAALVAPVLLTLVLTQTRGSLNLTSEALLYLLTVVGVACLGGVASALLAALTTSLLLNYYFIPPIHQFTIDEPNNVLALAAFAAVAVIVSTIVERATLLSHRAARATAEAETLSALARNVLGGEQAIPALLARLRETFGMDSVSLVRRGRSGPDTVLATATTATDRGSGAEGDAALEEVSVGGDAVLLLRGRPLPAADRRVLTAFAAHVGAALERERLTEAAAEAEPIESANRSRAALLAAVSHDLRDPLSVAVAAVTSLDSQDIELPAEDRRELFAVGRAALGKLARLVDDLLALSRLHTGSLAPDLQPTTVSESFLAAREALGEVPATVQEDGLDDAPAVLADPALLERILANLLANALLRTPEGAEIQVSARSLGDHVEVLVADRGPGAPVTDRDSVFDPFPPAGESVDARGSGVRLPLALSRGFAEAMGGSLTPEDTPGGGLTMVLALSTAE
ncbi:two-component system sensor histidine kinase KdpD [Streptacidiphilus sp. MAP12-16]|uniref:sensor histidine kinase n=1 Tax=Streptacidiphilus sp. MAP12-16 TaxID=3156300 RepID=UPI00351832A1